MTTQTEALKLALEALESERMYFWNSPEKIEKSISAVKEALARPEQEPVAWLSKGGKGIWFHEPHPFLEAVPLYTSPPPATEPHKCKPWVSLSTTDIGDCIGSSDGTMGSLIHATEAKLRKLNEAPQRKPLTDEELDLILQRSPIQANYGDLVALSRDIEAAHGITASEAEDSARSKTWM